MDGHEEAKARLHRVLVRREVITPEDKKIKLLKTIAFSVSVMGTGLVCFIVFFWLPKTDGGFNLSARQDPVVKAAIVDHLSISWPNPAFVTECTAILEDAGYDVDYYKGGDVTVELYRDLPTYGYKLIILRVHSAYVPKYLSLAMFTSEPYSKQRYIYEQLRNRVASGCVEPYQEGDPRYLVITDKFVRFSMEGSFDDAVVIMMGCKGIKKCAATAFIEKGAVAYVGWDGLVSARHTDRATIQFLKRLLGEKQTIAQAVTQTMTDLGHEPEYQSSFLFWPIAAGHYTFPTIKASKSAGSTFSG
jgi:hypothetical protein